MTTRSELHSLGVAVVLAVAACNSPTELPPEVTLAQDLAGAWNLVGLDGTPIPGWIRDCWLGCDSSYIAAGQLLFQPGSVCSRALTYATGQPPYLQRCSYYVSGDEASVTFEGGETPLRVSVSRDPATNDWTKDLTLWGPPCDPLALVCSQYREDYHKTNP